MARHCGLNRDDLEDMTIGMCLDFINEYVTAHDPEAEKVREAGQNDFDNF